MDLKEQKSDEIHKEMLALLKAVESKSDKGVEELHKVELDIFQGLLRLGLQLLSYYIFLVQSGLSRAGVPRDSQGLKMKNTGRQNRAYYSIFGKMKIERYKYYSARDKSVYILDPLLNLPGNSYSYALMDWLGYGAVEMDFAQSAAQLGRILGHDLTGMQSSRQTYLLSERVEEYYQDKDWDSTPDGSHLSVGYDGKGIPIIRSETDRKEESASVRLSRGQKKGVKKEATITVSSSFTPLVRDKQEILNNLFLTRSDREDKNKSDTHQWHQHKHIRAFLSAKQKAIGYGMDNLLQRDKTGSKPIVVLIDGDRALENAVKQVVAEKGLHTRVEAYILDFIHLLEYIWKVANAHLGETNEQRTEWVRQQAELFLDSQHEQVLQQWKLIESKSKLSKAQAYNLGRAITYVSNRPHMMDYKTYLKKGFPITTGAIESACGHFIKSRMERNAMHWGKTGAQKMLNIRAIKKNEDWDNYIHHFIQQELSCLYKKVA